MTLRVERNHQGLLTVFGENGEPVHRGIWRLPADHGLSVEDMTRRTYSERMTVAIVAAGLVSTDHRGRILNGEHKLALADAIERAVALGIELAATELTESDVRAHFDRAFPYGEFSCFIRNGLDAWEQERAKRPAMLTDDEAAELLGLDVSGVRGLVNAGHITMTRRSIRDFLGSLTTA
ncbi:MAG: hypothetical protein ACRDJT_09440 [Actinomycetota bacterium]